MRKLKIWWALAVFFLVWVFCLTVLLKNDYDDDKNILVNVISFWDVSSSVALSILAFIAYFAYSKEQNKKEKFLDELKTIKELSKESNKGALIIQFGGQNVIHEGLEFAKNTLFIPNELIISKKFGDEKGRITKDDISELKEFLENEVMQKLSFVDEIHVIYGVVGIGFAVISDVLNNWKNLYFYHKNSTYELWYIDKKSTLKLNSKNPLKEQTKDLKNG